MQDIFIGQSALRGRFHVWHAESESLIDLKKHGATNSLHRSIPLFADPFCLASLQDNKSFPKKSVEQFSERFVITDNVFAFNSSYKNRWCCHAMIKQTNPTNMSL